MACVTVLLLATTASGQIPDVPLDAGEIESLMEPDSVSPAEVPPPSRPTGIDLLSLISQGGRFMIPIGLMSVLVVTLAVERFISLRRKRWLPKGLVNQLSDLSRPIERFNPAAALQACQQYPSIAATAITAMLQRTGQPLAEVEHAASEAIQREADDQAAPIRWLSLAAAATPLMGLLGTVWGMIKAFHESTTLTAERSRSEQLSEGIYTALVTTLAGLIVAIPAAILAQYLENRMAKNLHRIERLAFAIAPGLARFVGRARLDESGVLRPLQASGKLPSEQAVNAVPPVAPPVAVPGNAPRVAVESRSRG